MDENAQGANVNGTLVEDGWEVYGFDDQKIGKIAEAHPDYLVVEKGWLFKTDLYIPMSAVSSTDAENGAVYVDAYKDQIETMGWDQPPVASTGTYDAGERTGTRDTVQLREEELAARKRQTEAGEVSIGKRVVSEQETMDVPVTHEEVEIERRPVGNRPAEGDIEEDSETVRVPLMREEVDVEKRPVVTEELELHKRPVTENRRVEETVRREEPVVEGADVRTTGGMPGTAGTTGAGASKPGTGEAVHEHRFVDGKCADCGWTP